MLITADVIKPFIKLEKDHVTLKYDSRPNSSLKANANISLANETNAFVDFNWNPIMDENGISFSMRPASGSIEPKSKLFCELSFHPSYSANKHAEFELEVADQSECRTLTCDVDLGQPEAQFHDRRINFGKIALNLTQKGEIFLKNISQYPAIYDLEIPGDVDGIELDPHEGVLQIGEIRRIDFKFTPQQSGKFDFPITAKIRNGKSCSIRIGGSVQVLVIDAISPR